MPEYLEPGVYIEEIARGPRPIEGVATSTAAFLGETERGPLAPLLVTTYAEFQRRFGDRFRDGRHLPDAARGFFDNGGQRLYVCRIVGSTATIAERTFGAFTAKAIGPGAWGTRVWARIDPASNAAHAFRLRLAYWHVISSGDEGRDAFAPENADLLQRASVVEDYHELSADPQAANYFAALLAHSVLAVLIRSEAAGDPEHPATGSGWLAEGVDHPDPLTEFDFVGKADDVRREAQGLSQLELEPYRDVALVYAPRPPDDADNIARRVIEHCEQHRFRFAVADCAAHVGPPSLDPRTDLADTQYAALYCPWIVVNDPAGGTSRLVPPGGHVLGIYARVDTDRGVFKAPANEVAKGAIDLEFALADGDQEPLNARGVNVIRGFPGRGIRVWGARTLSSNALWKYINLRRLFIFLERSICQGTQWVVFEPNGEPLWARVRDTIRQFLRAQWQAGALMGRTEDEAFFVRCDRTTMTEDDILNGRLICEIGIAPVRPAEFVIFRIFQHTAEAS